MTDHAADLLRFTIWALIAMGGLGLALIKWEALKFIERLDAQDKQLATIRELLASEVGKLREMQHETDVRVTRIEAHCELISKSNGKFSYDRNSSRD